MKIALSAAALLLLTATAQAQTDTAGSPIVAPPPAPAAPTQCAELPPDPVMPDGAHVRVADMGAGSDAFKAWREAARAVLECRRLQYNGVIDRMNSVSEAWNTQFHTFCARRDVRCTPVEQPAAQAAMPPTH